MRTGASEITVLLPVLNGEKYLSEAIASVAAQTFRNWRLWVLDDGSTDRTAEIARTWADTDPRIAYRPNGRNLGVAKTLNRAWRSVETPLVARMDADDVCLPERFELQVASFRRRPDLGLLGTRAVDAETGRPTFAVPLKAAAIRANLLFNVSFLHPTVMWRTDAFREHRLEYEEAPTAEDYDLWVRATVKMASGNLRRPLLRYRSDPEVKLGRYVQQQKDGGRRIRESLVRELGIEPEREEMEVHHALAYDNLPQPAVELRRVDSWLERLWMANQRVLRFEPAALRDRLWAQRYYHLARNLPGFSLRRGWIPSSSGLGSPTPSMLVRIGLQWLRKARR